MASSRRNGLPAYQKIQRAVRQHIEAKQLKPGDGVSSERELVVERRPGAGTFVAPPRIHFNKLMSYTEQMGSRGLTPNSKVIVAKIIEGEPEIAARLGLATTNRLVKIERVRHTADEPFALETCYLPADEFSALVDAPLGRISLFATLEHD